ncbi:MAG: hypothetical protein RBT76_09620 [candidate division Zixibacteria bacterium]|jgi:hypothetical protein|nr:hypothetical protein [candidate division Zixibacteria bacterium]
MARHFLKSKLAVISIILTLAAAVNAAPPDGVPPENTATDSMSVYERRIDLTVDGLTHAVELWHDANLLENPDLVARYEILIDNILRADLRATEMVLKTIEAESKADGTDGDPEIKAELEDTHRVLFEKEKLARQVRDAKTFSEKYRYLGGYINALRRELGMPKLRLADDKEFLEDANRNH